MVRKLKKNPNDILKTMDSKKMDLLHLASKLCSESGELMDAVGKLCYYNKPLDTDNVIEELGDIEFYLEGLRQTLGITREETILSNIKKLAKRYSNFEYTDQKARERADKT